jgi:hypothetical protein
MIQSSFLSFTELFQYMQKQLLPVNAHGEGASGSGGVQTRDTNDYSSRGDSSINGGAASLNVLNMYTSTVIKILQQAVDEIKRGIDKIKIQNINAAAAAVAAAAKNESTGVSSSSSGSAGSQINQLQLQQIQASLAYSKAVADPATSAGGDSPSSSPPAADPYSFPSSPVQPQSVSSSSSTASTSNPASPSTTATTSKATPAAAAASTLNDLDASLDSSNSSSFLDSSSSSPQQPQQPQPAEQNLVVSATSAATSNGGDKTNGSGNVEMAHFDRTLVVIVHFLIVVAESLKYCSPEETYKLKKLVYELIKVNN